jgi:hypothetical protein
LSEKYWSESLDKVAVSGRGSSVQEWADDMYYARRGLQFRSDFVRPVYPKAFTVEDQGTVWEFKNKREALEAVCGWKRSRLEYFEGHPEEFDVEFVNACRARLMEAESELALEVEREKAVGIDR